MIPKWYLVISGDNLTQKTAGCPSSSLFNSKTDSPVITAVMTCWLLTCWPSSLFNTLSGDNSSDDKGSPPCCLFHICIFDIWVFSGAIGNNGHHCQINSGFFWFCNLKPLQKTLNLRLGFLKLRKRSHDPLRRSIIIIPILKWLTTRMIVIKIMGQFDTQLDLVNPTLGLRPGRSLKLTITRVAGA